MRPKTTILLSKEFFSLKFLVFTESLNGIAVKIPKDIDGVSSTGQDEAQKAHISDLREILFSFLGAKK